MPLFHCLLVFGWYGASPGTGLGPYRTVWCFYRMPCHPCHPRRRKTRMTICTWPSWMMAGGSKPLRFQELLKEVKSLRGQSSDLSDLAKLSRKKMSSCLIIFARTDCKCKCTCIYIYVYTLILLKCPNQHIYMYSYAFWHIYARTWTIYACTDVKCLYVIYIYIYMYS